MTFGHHLFDLSSAQLVIKVQFYTTSFYCRQRLVHVHPNVSLNPFLLNSHKHLAVEGLSPPSPVANFAPRSPSSQESNGRCLI